MALPLDWDTLSDEAKNAFREHVLSGGIFVLSTETVYGLAGNAALDSACREIFRAKNRPSDNPLIVHVADPERISDYATLSGDLERRLIDAFMPGPLTIILAYRAGVCDAARAGGDTLAIRVPEHALAREILRFLDCPIAAPSANPSGLPSATSAAMACAYFSELGYIWDGGDCDYGLESTIVRVMGDTVRILRPWYIAHEDIEQILLPHEHVVYGSGGASEAVIPWAKYRHYAPKAEVNLLDSSDHIAWINTLSDIGKTALIASDEYAKKHAEVLASVPDLCLIRWGSVDTLALLASKLYGLYDRLDREGFDRVFVEPVSTHTGLGRAIMNRVEKSAARR